MHLYNLLRAQEVVLAHRVQRPWCCRAPGGPCLPAEPASNLGGELKKFPLVLIKNVIVLLFAVVLVFAQLVFILVLLWVLLVFVETLKKADFSTSNGMRPLLCQKVKV